MNRNFMEVLDIVLLLSKDTLKPEVLDIVLLLSKDTLKPGHDEFQQTNNRFFF